MTPRPCAIAQAILDDLQPRDTVWFTHDILTVTVPKILSAAPYLNQWEQDRILTRAQAYDRVVWEMVELAMTNHERHTTSRINP